ncbi:hypothetical protein [Vibrio jasicida]|uniref:hypothetical protein n=1 Tax=Vibrio jasicida TaxID=766224 RepID=UPI0005ED978D|nr:hypothetical protein [Vibrio jasicida]
MKQIRLLCRSAHTYGFHKNKTGFDKHNFRLDDLAPEEQNYNPESSKNNVIFRYGEPVKPSKLTDLLTEIEADQHNKLKQAKGGMSDKYVGELNLARSKSKSKLKRWVENASNPLERDFFCELLARVGIDKIHAKAELKTLSSFGKIKRFNDKKKAITKLEECNKLLEVKDNGSMSLKVISSEKIFRIPDQHNINVSAQDWHKLISQFHNKFYNDYDAYYTAIHLDEKAENPHAHHRLSGYNNVTKQFDLPDHELNLVRKLYNKPDLFNSKKWSKLTPNEVEQFGQLYQNIMFKYCNTQLQKMGYGVNAVKRTPQEVKQDAHEYSNLKIRHRVHNGVNQLNDDKTELIEAVNNLKYQEQHWKDKAIQEQKTAINWNKKAKQQKVLFQRTKANLTHWFEEKFEQWFNGLLRFKKSNLAQDLAEPIELHLILAQEREQAGKILMNEVELALQQDQLRRYKQEFNRQEIKSRYKK